MTDEERKAIEKKAEEDFKEAEEYGKSVVRALSKSFSEPEPEPIILQSHVWEARVKSFYLGLVVGIIIGIIMTVIQYKIHIYTAAEIEELKQRSIEHGELYLEGQE